MNQFVFELIIGNYILTAAMLFIGSWLDAKLFQNPFTKKLTVEEFPDDLSDKNLFLRFLKVNLRESILWLGGFSAGMIAMYYLGVMG